MSFAFLPLYTGDYLRDTQHLSCSEHGIYLKWLMHCWDQKGPLPLDERKQAGICNARSGDEVEAMRRVRDEFFVQMDDGWYNDRMHREIVRAGEISNKREDAGRRGANERMRRLRESQANAKQVLSKSLASDATPTLTPIPPSDLPLNSKSKTTPRQNRAVAFVLPDWIPKMQWDAWIESRTKRRNPPTDWVKQLAVRKLEVMKDEGHSPARVLAESAFNGWAGLFIPKES